VAAVGRVLGTSGAPVAGARVWLYAWPVTSVLTKVAAGKPVPLRLVGSAVSSPSGYYTVRVSSVAGLRASAGPGGVVNLELVAHTPRGDGAYSFPRRLVGGGTALAGITGAAKSSGASPEERNLRIDLTHGADAARIAFCPPEEMPYKRLGAEWAKLGAMDGRYTGYRMNFTYSAGQSSSFSIGVSSSAAGGFSASGTYSTSTSSSWNYGHQISPAGNYYQTEVIPEEYRWVYPCTGGVDFYQTNVIEIAGGGRTQTFTPPNVGNCFSYQQGITFTKDTTTAYTISIGVNEKEIGFEASAQTGYDSQASVTYTFTKDGWLCGLNGPPAGNPGLLVGGRP
jgi:hypothetical protein